MCVIKHTREGVRELGQKNVAALGVQNERGPRAQFLFHLGHKCQLRALKRWSFNATNYLQNQAPIILNHRVVPIDREQGQC